MASAIRPPSCSELLLRLSREQNSDLREEVVKLRERLHASQSEVHGLREEVAITGKLLDEALAAAAANAFAQGTIVAAGNARGGGGGGGRAGTATQFARSRFWLFSILTSHRPK